MLVKRLLVFLISLSLAYAPVALAVPTNLLGAGWTKNVVDGHTIWMGPSIMDGSKSGNAVGQMIWNSAVGGASGGTVTQAVNLAVGASEAAVVAKGVVTGASVFAAFRAATGGPLGLALLAAPAVIDWLNEGGVRSVSSGATHGKLFEVKNTDSCVGSCPTFIPTSIYGLVPSGTYTSAQAACNAAYLIAGTNFTAQFRIEGQSCVGRHYTGEERTYGYFSQGQLVNVPENWIPASMDDIAPYMTDRAASAAAIQAMLAHNATIQVQPTTITGPAEVLEPSTKTTTETAEKLTTTTTNPKTKLDYLTKLDPLTGQTVPYVKATPSSTTTVVEKDKATGVETVVSTTTTEAPKPAETPDLCALHPEIVACASVDEVDMCKKYPDSLACQETDEPEVEELETIEKPVTFAPDGGWGGGGGSCPAPRHLVSGMGAEFSFQPFCDFMSALRPVFIGVAWLSGAMILIGANRKE